MSTQARRTSAALAQRRKLRRYLAEQEGEHRHRHGSSRVCARGPSLLQLSSDRHVYDLPTVRREAGRKPMSGGAGLPIRVPHNGPCRLHMFTQMAS